MAVTGGSDPAMFAQCITLKKVQCLFPRKPLTMGGFAGKEIQQLRMFNG